MYLYETHLHTAPVSRCGKGSVRDTLISYKERGYDGIFITNHFLDGNINIDRDRPYEEKIAFYFSDVEEGKRLAPEIGIKVFEGVELTYGGTDFLVYGLDKAWFLAHPEIMTMKKSEELPMLRAAGALVVQAHPYREAGYIDHIRLFPRCIDAVEVINASQPELANRLADVYADAYGLCKTAGSDNHNASAWKHLAGVMTEEPLESEQDFIRAVLERRVQIFTKDFV
ncbi:MAG: PHP domain-containing protein [Clostridia bacterium]|nr:PHP domain-containing protein [Clostridia bacterium]